MKITYIEIEEKTYTLTYTPNWVQKLFGYKTKKIDFIDNGDVYYHFSNLTAFMVKSTGGVLSPISKECELLNNYKRKLGWAK